MGQFFYLKNEAKFLNYTFFSTKSLAAMERLFLIISKPRDDVQTKSAECRSAFCCLFTFNCT